MTLLALIVAWLGAAPPVGESTAERGVRLESIAVDASGACAGERACAVALLAVVARESSFRLDVDSGHCPPHECDGGRALCLAQIQPASAEERDEILSSRRGCFDVAIRRLRASARACPAHPFAVYATGACGEAGEGHAAEVRRWRARAGL